MVAMSVTATGPFDIRNAVLFTRCTDGSVWWATCTTCGRRVKVACKDPEATHPAGRLQPAEIHCCTCGTSWDHNSCHACGACLPSYQAHDKRLSGARRTDTLYCTNACRQRAYRQRRAAR